MSAVLFPLAALAEILGCFAVWSWWRAGASPWWLLPGTAALAVFAFLLALTPTAQAGRSFAVYGGVYIAASLIWLRLADGEALRMTDYLGGALALVGAGVVLAGAR